MPWPLHKGQFTNPRPLQVLHLYSLTMLPTAPCVRMVPMLSVTVYNSVTGRAPPKHPAAPHRTAPRPLHQEQELSSNSERVGRIFSGSSSRNYSGVER
jgi:hypothetical protein